jgi:hypothetical protein
MNEPLAIGQTVRRMIDGELFMELRVTAISDSVITCSAWTFDRATGAEIDDDLGWGPAYGRTGSYLELAA